MNRAFFSVVALGLTVGAAVAQPYYLRGEFNGWGTGNQMNDLGGGHYSATIGGLTAGQLYEFKVAVEDWSFSAPGSNTRTAADASGNLTVHFYEGAASDGWMPTENRVGYDDPLQFDWEVVGSLNGWPGGPGSLVLSNMGNGVYQGQFNIAEGTHEWKFRKLGDWGVSIGDNFGNSAANNSLTVVGSDPILFTLDLPNGRWSAVAVPEPASLGALAFGGLALLRRRRNS